MYQLANDSPPLDRTRLFIETCTSMIPTGDNLNLVRSAAQLMRAALRSTDLRPLCDFVARAGETCDDLDDVVAAAGQAVVDEFDDAPHGVLHDTIRRVAQIERDVLSSTRRDSLRTVFAG
jgi:hypothetical protein